MNISAESYGHAVMLNVDGELTEDSLAAFLQTVNHQLENKEVIDLAINMEAVPFVDSAALACLLDLQDRLAERLGQVKLVRLNESIEGILRITRLRAQFEVYDDCTEAVKAIRA